MVLDLLTALDQRLVALYKLRNLAIRTGHIATSYSIGMKLGAARMKYAEISIHAGLLDEPYFKTAIDGDVDENGDDIIPF